MTTSNVIMNQQILDAHVHLLGSVRVGIQTALNALETMIRLSNEGNKGNGEELFDNSDLQQFHAKLMESVSGTFHLYDFSPNLEKLEKKLGNMVVCPNCSVVYNQEHEVCTNCNG